MKEKTYRIKHIRFIPHLTMKEGYCRDEEEFTAATREEAIAMFWESHRERAGFFEEWEIVRINGRKPKEEERFAPEE
jgi:hypothetical protein